MPNTRASKPVNDAINGRIVPANADWIVEAAHLLRGGALVAFPTETVYGLGADATNGEAVARIFEAKKRPAFNPLIVHILGIEQAVTLGEFSIAARRLAETFWPGPLTLVVQKQRDAHVSDLVSAGLPTIALRAPDHPIARTLLKDARRPIAAPSANRSGHLSPTLAEHVAADLGGEPAVILDGGATAHGLESTVLSLTGSSPVLLRPGALPAEVIEEVIGEPLARTTETGGALTSPGQLESHYAPRSMLRLNVETWSASDVVLAFGPVVAQPARALINISPSGDLVEAASKLFAALRALDAIGGNSISAMPIPDHGLGEAINDRLRRAAAPRRG